MRAEARDKDRERIGKHRNGGCASHIGFMLASHVGRSSDEYRAHLC